MSVTTEPRTAGLRRRLKIWLATPRALVWLVLLGIALTLPSLGGGLAADDYLHAVVLAKLPFPHPMTGPLDLFRFSDGNPATARELMDIGEFPWTTDPTARFAFFRPIAAATHTLDYALWPHAPWLMHAQSVAWFGLALVGAALLYRRLLGPTWVAGLALLLYAVDDTHGMAVGWIANRNAVIALALSFPVLLSHHYWRQASFRAGSWAGPVLLAIALLAGESAIASLAYLAAYALHIDRGTWRKRIYSLAPYVLVLLLWRVAYVKLGYGVSGSGLYIDPAANLVGFLSVLPTRLPFLLVGAFGVPRSDFGQAYEYISPALVAVMLSYSVAILAILAVALAPLLRRDPVARFFATGAVLAAVPICAAFVCDRLLLFVGIGAMGLVAKLIASAESLFRRIVATLLGLVHLVLAPPLLMVRSGFVDYQAFIDLSAATIPKGPDIATKTVVLVNPPNDLFYVYLPAIRAVRGEPRPQRLRGLANVLTAAEVTRLDDRTLRIRPEGGFLQYGAEMMLRDRRHPLPTGTSIDVAGMRVTIIDSTADGRPTAAEFRFDRSLEDPLFVWMCWSRKGYVPWTPPAIGDTAHLPAHGFRRFMLDMEDRLSAG